MYSHASPARDKLYRILSKYKEVDILGPYPHTGQEHDRFVYNENVTFYDLAVEHYQMYKFVISGENSAAPGYITEKIINAMLAKSIPIYVGAPDVSDTFNPRSFVNANDMDEAELLRLIVLLDTNDSEYFKMAMEPWFIGNSLPDWFEAKNSSRLLSPVTTLILKRINDKRIPYSDRRRSL